MIRLAGAMRRRLCLFASIAILCATPTSILLAATGDGINPSDSVICEGGAPGYGNGVFYGVTYTGGANKLGTVYSVVPAYPSPETILHSFTGTDGSNPVGMLAGPPNSASSGNSTLYGVTYSGGVTGVGTIFSVTTGGVFKSLCSFTGTNGAHPTSVIWDGASTLYGTCSGGGASSAGTIFSFSLATSQLSTLHTMTGGSDGGTPQAGLFLDHSSIYGTASKGGSGYGTVYSLATNGAGFAVLHSFNNADGATPACQFITETGTTTLLGTTEYGGAGGAGTVFSIGENGAGFKSLASFGPAGLGNTSGAYPSNGFASYVPYGTEYCGVTSSGGYGQGGVLYFFSLTQGISPQQDFTSDPQNGFYPMGYDPVGPPTPVYTILNGPIFYMVINYDGGHNSDGVLFSWIGQQPNFMHTFGP